MDDEEIGIKDFGILKRDKPIISSPPPKVKKIKKIKEIKEPAPTDPDIFVDYSDIVLPPTPKNRSRPKIIIPNTIDISNKPDDKSELETYKELIKNLINNQSLLKPVEIKEKKERTEKQKQASARNAERLTQYHKNKKDGPTTDGDVIQPVKVEQIKMEQIKAEPVKKVIKKIPNKILLNSRHVY